MDLNAKINGIVVDIMVTEGAILYKGDTLYIIQDEKGHNHKCTVPNHMRIEKLCFNRGDAFKVGDLMGVATVLKMIYFDTETTGTDSMADEILQLSVIDDSGDTLYNGYFHPLWHTSWEEAEKVNHISPAMVENCPTLNDELEKIQAIFTNAIAVGYNTDFDKGFLEHANISFDTTKAEDVWAKVKKIRADAQGVLAGTPNGKLTTIAEFLGFDYSKMDAHNSLTDVFATKWVNERL